MSYNRTFMTQLRYAFVEYQDMHIGVHQYGNGASTPPSSIWKDFLIWDLGVKREP